MSKCIAVYALSFAEWISYKITSHMHRAFLRRISNGLFEYMRAWNQDGENGLEAALTSSEKEVI